MSYKERLGDGHNNTGPERLTPSWILYRNKNEDAYAWEIKYRLKIVSVTSVANVNDLNAQRYYFTKSRNMKASELSWTVTKPSKTLGKKTLHQLHLMMNVLPVCFNWMMKIKCSDSRVQALWTQEDKAIFPQQLTLVHSDGRRQLVVMTSTFIIMPVVSFLLTLSPFSVLILDLGPRWTRSCSGAIPWTNFSTTTVSPHGSHKVQTRNRHKAASFIVAWRIQGVQWMCFWMNEQVNWVCFLGPINSMNVEQPCRTKIFVFIHSSYSSNLGANSILTWWADKLGMLSSLERSSHCCYKETKVRRTVFRILKREDINVSICNSFHSHCTFWF